ncbi:transglycosylase domain-containing protein [Pseudonocardia nematodicida]|uniref:transglycosylase domain-containing protein n=1 Tax=Pseudonocardia nematodicida TaxID=1206997 RepID=UPI0036144DCC
MSAGPPPPPRSRCPAEEPDPDGYGRSVRTRERPARRSRERYDGDRPGDGRHDDRYGDDRRGDDRPRRTTPARDGAPDPRGADPARRARPDRRTADPRRRRDPAADARPQTSETGARRAATVPGGPHRARAGDAGPGAPGHGAERRPRPAQRPDEPGTATGATRATRTASTGATRPAGGRTGAHGAAGTPGGPNTPGGTPGTPGGRGSDGDRGARSGPRPQAGPGALGGPGSQSTQKVGLRVRGGTVPRDPGAPAPAPLPVPPRGGRSGATPVPGVPGGPTAARVPGGPPTARPAPSSGSDPEAGPPARDDRSAPQRDRGDRAPRGRRAGDTGGTRSGRATGEHAHAESGSTSGRRRRRAGPAGPWGRVVAFAGPGVEVARRRLGILDAEQKAALSPAQRRTRRRTQIRYSLVGTAASVVLLPLLVLGLGWLMFPVPSPDDAVQNQIATVSFADGDQLARLVPEQGNRIRVSMDAIPVHVREAVLAAEDRSFYSNPGFDLTGIARAVLNQLSGGAGGGSTITQQYVKNTLVGNDATYWRKYKELVISLKVSGQKSKDEILNDYLNAIYYGRGAYGIESASLAYYGKPAAQLSPSEGALLAGIIQSPSNWDPAVAPERAEARWNFVLDGMMSQGWLSEADRRAAVFPETIPPENTSRSSSLTDERGHILNAVRAELGSLGISEQAFAQGGLQVTTTIDPARQQELTESVRARMEGQPEVLRTGAVAIDPRTGGIVGYYGGANGTGLDYAQVMKQPGSTFKPFAVLAGLLSDPPIGLGTVYDGSERPGLRNAEGANCPSCDLKQAMTISNNVVFTQLAREVGPQKVADAARLAGITAPMEEPDARLPLGNKEVTPVQLASSYATIAAGGVWHAPHLVSSVVDSDGRLLYEYEPGDGEQRFSDQVARNVTEAMIDVVSHDDLDLPRGQVAAGKTGTVQSRFEGENNDAWFAGFTPELATAVWVGTDRNDPIRNAAGSPINGRDLPAAVWQGFMSSAVRGGEVAEFPTFRALGSTPSSLSANEPATPVAPPTSTAPEPTTPEEPAAPDVAPPPEDGAPPPPDQQETPAGPDGPGAPEGTPPPAGEPEPLRAQQEEPRPGEEAGRRDGDRREE